MLPPSDFQMRNARGMGGRKEYLEVSSKYDYRVMVS